MRLENGVVDDVQVLHFGRALIVHDHVKTLGPVRILVNRIEMAGAFVGIVGDGPFDIGAGGDALGDDVLLMKIVVAAPAADEQPLIGCSSAALATRGETRNPHAARQGKAKRPFS